MHQQHISNALKKILRETKEDVEDHNIGIDRAFLLMIEHIGELINRIEHDEKET